MPKNIGLYNNNLSVPRKQDIDNVQNELNQLTTDLDIHIGDINNPHKVTKEQVGLSNVANVLQYSANNPPPYPVTSVNGNTGEVLLTASSVNAVPTSRTINNKPLSSNISLTASDVGALPTQVGTQGQFLGFISDNVVGAVDKPTSSSTFNTTYKGKINNTGWISSNGKYYKQFNLSSMTSDQTPLVFPQWTTNVDNEQLAWGELTSIQSYNGYVRFYANSPINTTVNFILLYTTYDNNLVALSTNGSNVIGTFTPM